RRAAAAWTSSCGLLGTAERTGWRAIASVATGPPGFLAFLAPTPTLPRKRRREQKLAAQPAARPRLDPSPQAEEAQKLAARPAARPGLDSLPRLRGRVGVGAAGAAMASTYVLPTAQTKKPRRSGAFSCSWCRRSEPVLRRNAVQVGTAVEGADHAAAASGDVHLRVVRLQVAEGEVDVERVADRPGRADRVPAAIVVGQARGAVHEAGRRLVVGDAAAQGPAVVELVLGAQRGEGRIAPFEGLDRIRIGVAELDAHLFQRRPAGLGEAGRHREALVDLPVRTDLQQRRRGQLGAARAVEEQRGRHRTGAE